MQSAPISNLPNTLSCFANCSCRIVPTAGDGACAIHSVFGNASDERGCLKLWNARQFMRTQLGDSIEEFQEKVNDPNLCFALANDIWLEAIRPLATAKLFPDTDMVDTGHEANLIWKFIEKEPALCDMILYEVQALHDKETLFLKKRNDMADAFAPLCVRPLEHCFLRALFAILGRTDEYCNEHFLLPGAADVQTKLEVLLSKHPEATRIRKGIVETLGMDHLDLLVEKIEDIISSDDAFPFEYLHDFHVFFQKVKEVAEHPRRDQDGDFVQKIFAKIYKCYLAAATSNKDNYYLSDTELRCLCRCAQQNVVICKYDITTKALSYHTHDFVNCGQPVFTAIQVKPDEPQIRSHFEQVLLESMEAANILHEPRNEVGAGSAQTQSISQNTKTTASSALVQKQAMADIIEIPALSFKSAVACTSSVSSHEPIAPKVAPGFGMSTFFNESFQDVPEDRNQSIANASDEQSFGMAALFDEPFQVAQEDFFKCKKLLR